MRNATSPRKFSSGTGNTGPFTQITFSGTNLIEGDFVLSGRALGVERPRSEIALQQPSQFPGHFGLLTMQVKSLPQIGLQIKKFMPAVPMINQFPFSLSKSEAIFFHFAGRSPP